MLHGWLDKDHMQKHAVHLTAGAHSPWASQGTLCAVFWVFRLLLWVQLAGAWGRVQMGAAQQSPTMARSSLPCLHATDTMPHAMLFAGEAALIALPVC